MFSQFCLKSVFEAWAKAPVPPVLDLEHLPLLDGELWTMVGDVGVEDGDVMPDTPGPPAQ